MHVLLHMLLKGESETAIEEVYIQGDLLGLREIVKEAPFAVLVDERCLIFREPQLYLFSLHVAEVELGRSEAKFQEGFRGIVIVINRTFLLTLRCRQGLLTISVFNFCCLGL